MYVVKRIAYRHGAGYVVRYYFVYHYREEVVGRAFAYFQRVFFYPFCHVVEKHRFSFGKTYYVVAPLYESYGRGTFCREDACYDKIEIVVFFYFGGVLDVEDVLYGKEVNAVVLAYFFYGVGVFETVYPEQQLFAFVYPVCQLCEGVAYCLAVFPRFVSRCVDVRVGDVRPVVKEAFGEQVVFHLSHCCLPERRSLRVRGTAFRCCTNLLNVPKLFLFRLTIFCFVCCYCKRFVFLHFCL